MVLIKNKRGIFFITIAIVVLSLFFIMYTISSSVKERGTTGKRVDSLNGFVLSIEEDIPRQLKTSSFRIIFLLEKRIIESGEYISEFNSTFSELFFNGTINGETNAETNIIMEGAKFSDIESSLKEKASKINAELDIVNPSITISQKNPWNIELVLMSNIIINDKSSLALWNKTENITVLLPIENFEDPIYIVNTNSLVTNKIRKSPYDIFVTEEDSSNLLSHLQNSYYISSTDAPSFIDRLEGINSPNPNGIESLVYLPKLSSQGISVSDKSAVDHIYFSQANPSSSQISGMPSWFKLDSAHLSIYNSSA